LGKIDFQSSFPAFFAEKATAEFCGCFVPENNETKQRFEHHAEGSNKSAAKSNASTLDAH
jgi:hypothetical protein